MFATCSFCVCYMFAKQKYGFCRVKVWFLACKKGVFALQKYGFWFLNVMLLQIVHPHFVVECGYFAECSPYYSNSLAALWQTVSSRRGAIYRARISVNAHKMGDRSAFSMKRICVFDNGKIRIWQCKNTGTMNRSPTPNGVSVGNFVRCICHLLCPECT